MKSTTHNLGRFGVNVSDIGVKLQTKHGTFHFGVDNDGQPYISTDMTRLVVIPSASNRINIFEEKR